MIDSPAQLVAILVVALLLFGPRKLPELARGLGQSVREFKKSVEGLAEEPKTEKEDPQAVPHAPQPKPPVEGERSPRG
ncbi:MULTISPECIES: Sec-independent protein translocase subunit TatA/TatB [Thermus]|jgi:sec-independent protein translocase protein TatA|uniref:Sec-independent protein translocase subunit TatA/TatB n=1 Tax=Thermus TaxID=270 RepID=UPI000CF88270|nr:MULTISPECIES: twin-arginine translocase TatA/TatE family subunit [Thermus]QWK21468.1 MAG: twin-arginine translocase TatA/TatE family subunit [Thermus antranikianii]